jgi:hypothetical protein
MIQMLNRPLQVRIDMNERMSCECGWVGKAGDTIKAMWIDPARRTPPPVGDGYNLRCPMCKLKVKVVRYL